MAFFNKTKIYNHQVYLNCLDANYKEKKHALITICNHWSCLDDPFILSALLPWSWNLNSVRHRFAGAAHNICYSNQLHSLFFSLGKCVPIYRGAGIYQPSLNFLLELIRSNQFIHVFPQGKVIEENYKEQLEQIKLAEDFNYKQLDLRDKKDEHLNYAFKWGLARLILDSLSSNQNMKIIELLLFYHVGMDLVLPDKKPYIPQTNKRVTIFIAENSLKITNEFLKELCKGLSCTSEKRIRIMYFLEEEMKKVKLQALKKHFLIE